jgi:hypothetical protein
VCLYGSTASAYFDCSPPTLEQYFDGIFLTRDDPMHMDDDSDDDNDDDNDDDDNNNNNNNNNDDDNDDDNDDSNNDDNNNKHVLEEPWPATPELLLLEPPACGGVWNAALASARG